MSLGLASIQAPAPVKPRVAPKAQQPCPTSKRSVSPFTRRHQHKRKMGRGLLSSKTLPRPSGTSNSMNIDSDMPDKRGRKAVITEQFYWDKPQTDLSTLPVITSIAITLYCHHCCIMLYLCFLGAELWQADIDTENVKVTISTTEAYNVP